MTQTLIVRGQFSMFPSRQPSYPACVGGSLAALVATMEVCRGRNGSRTGCGAFGQSGTLHVHHRPNDSKGRQGQNRAWPPGIQRFRGRRSIGYTSNRGPIESQVWVEKWLQVDGYIESTHWCHSIGMNWGWLASFWEKILLCLFQGIANISIICVCLRHIALTLLFYCGSNVLHCVPWGASELRNLIKHNNVDLLSMYIYIYISLHIRTARELLGEWLQEWVTIARHNLIVMNL